jgi:hypothetical protein
MATVSGQRQQGQGSALDRRLKVGGATTAVNGSATKRGEQVSTGESDLRAHADLFLKKSTMTFKFLLEKKKNRTFCKAHPTMV